MSEASSNSRPLDIGRDAARAAQNHPIRVHDALASYLAEAGTRYCFGLAGNTNFKVTHALIKAGVPFVATRHECNAVTMADGYTKATGELSVVSVHAGPGLTNALTGIGEAAKSRTPIVVLVGDVAASDLTATFHIDQAAIVRSVGATPFRVNSPATALSDIAKAVAFARRNRQTVVVSLPMDVQHADLPPESFAPNVVSDVVKPSMDADALMGLADMLERAERPLILAGRGAVLSGAGEALARLAGLSGALVTTTLQANGLFPGERWNLGICGGFASEGAGELILKSDLVIGFGAGFTFWTTRHGEFFGPGTTVVQIDSDPHRLGFHRSVDRAVVADARKAAEQLIAEMTTRATSQKPTWRTESIAAEIAAFEHNSVAYDDVSTDVFIDPRTLSKAIDQMVPRSRALAIDNGHFMAWPPRHIKVSDARLSSMGGGFQSVGLGLAAATGLALANPERITVLGTGDGGYMMSLADLETAIRLKLKLCIVIYDDAGFGAEVHPYAAEGDDISFVQFPDLDLAAIARSMGAEGIVVRQQADLAPLQDWIDRGSPGVFVIDAKINPTFEGEWHIRLTRKASH